MNAYVMAASDGAGRRARFESFVAAISNAKRMGEYLRAVETDRVLGRGGEPLARLVVEALVAADKDGGPTRDLFFFEVTALMSEVLDGPNGTA